MLVGLVFVKAVPHITPSATQMRPSFESGRGRQSSQTPLLRDTDSHDVDGETDLTVGADQLDEVMTAHDVELSPGRRAPRHQPLRGTHRKAHALHDPLRNVHGMEMFKTTEFWLLFVITSLCECYFSSLLNHFGFLTSHSKRDGYHVD